MKIYQHVDEFNQRDGIGNDILGFQSLFQKLQIENSIITRINKVEGFKVIKITDSINFQLDDLHILHFGGTGYPIDFFQNIPGKKILRFHNITPVPFFQGFVEEDVYNTFERNEMKSYLELHSLHHSLFYVLSDSLFNQNEYFNFVGEKRKVNLEVMPIVRSYPVKTKTIGKGTRIGFLGRWAPNKKIEDLLFTLYFLKKINPNYSLVLFGKKNSIFKRYNEYIIKLITELNLSESVEFYENLNDTELEAKFSDIDIYLSMSEHEGFGIPILEAMSFGVPVLAYSCSAVKEILKDAGILFTKKDFPRIAELIETIRTRPNLQKKIIESQMKCLNSFEQFPFTDKIKAIINN